MAKFSADVIGELMALPTPPFGKKRGRPDHGWGAFFNAGAQNFMAQGAGRMEDPWGKVGVHCQSVGLLFHRGAPILYRGWGNYMLDRKYWGD